MTSALIYNPTSTTTTTTGYTALLAQPSVLANPYPLYHQLRQQYPVFWESSLQKWLVTGYAEVASVLRDPRLSSSRDGSLSKLPKEYWPQLAPLYELLSKMMVLTDQPDHHRLRTLVSKAFTPRSVAQMQQRISQLIDQLLDKVEEQGHFEAVADLAVPLPITVIAQLLGVPACDRSQFKKWSAALIEMLKPEISTKPQRALELWSNVLELKAYLGEIIAEMRRRLDQPHQALAQDETLLRQLIQAEHEGQRLSEDELIANCLLLLAAGHETTTNLIAVGLATLLQSQHHTQLTWLKEQPTLVAQAVEELLRYESPVQLIRRRATENLHLGSNANSPLIRAGQSLLLVIGAANRDPAQFAGPNHFDITRPLAENKHLAFGQGVHYCLGAFLARLEAQLALSAVLTRFPRLELALGTDEELEWQPNLTVRALKALPLTF